MHTPKPTLPSFGIYIPRTEYDMLHKAGLHSIWAWEEYNGRTPDNEAIFAFLNIKRTQGFEILKSESVRSLKNQSNEHPRRRHRIMTAEKSKEIAHLLDTEDDAQHLT